jgi:thiol-disulfide isomerase/thioredoxin
LSSFPIDAEKWLLGATLNNYVAGMQTFQADMQRRLAEVQLKPEEIARFSRVSQPVKVSVLSEDWCIDCMMTLPILAHIAAAAAAVELRIFSRSKWPAMKEYYNGLGIMAIPVYSFLKPNFEEFGAFIERPQLAAQKMAEWKAAHPEIDQIRRSFSMSSEEKSQRLAVIRQQMQVEMEGWYRESCQSGMVEEIAAILGV